MRKLWLVLIALMIIQSVYAIKNQALEQVVQALEKNDIDAFQKAIENRDQGLFVIAKDDMENAKKFFTLLGAFKTDSDFINFFLKSKMQLIFFGKQHTAFLDFQKKSLVEDQEKNTILHYIAKYMPSDANATINSFWLNTIKTMCSYVSMIDQLQKNDKDKTFIDIILERKFSKNLEDNVLLVIDQGQAFYYKQVIIASLQQGHITSVLGDIKSQTPEMQKLIFEIPAGIYSEEPLLHSLFAINLPKKENYISLILGDYPQFATIRNLKNGQNLLHALIKYGDSTQAPFKTLVKKLLSIDNSALAQQKDKDGKTPLDYVKEQNDPDVLQIINNVQQEIKDLQIKIEAAENQVFEFAKTLADIK